MSNAANMATVEGLISNLMAGDTDASVVLEDVAISGITGLPKGACLVAIMSKATKNEPAKREPNAFAIVKPGESIRLFGIRYGTAYDRTFAIGELAEYHSYNLSYYGRIASITAKTITVHDKSDIKATHRLDLHHFNWRNYGFDLAATNAKNAVERMAI